MNKLHLTKSLIASLPVEGKRYAVGDESLPGLQLHVMESGAKIFYVRKKLNGRAVKVRVGRFPDEVPSPTKARELALPEIGKIAQGINPNDERRAEREQGNLDSLCKLYFDLHLKIRAKRYKPIKALYDNHVPQSLKKRRLSEISRVDMKRLHTRLGETVGPSAANATLRMVCAAYYFCIDELGFGIINPAARIKKFPEKRRRIRLLQEHIPTFFDVVDKMKKDTPHTADYVLLLLYTGARSVNVRTMRWSNIDMKNRVWTVPGEEMKNGEEFVVPLIPLAIDIIKSRHSLLDNPYVFHSARNADGYIKANTHRDNWVRAKKDTPISQITFHDLRRSHGSWMANLGTSKDLLKAALGHKSDEANDIYTWVDIEPVRKAKEETVAKILQFKKTG